LFWWVPGFHQIEIEADFVDAGDGGFGISIGSQQHLACLWVEGQCLGQKLCAAHFWHALVYQKEGDGFVALFKLLYGR
jgi:hypothetical protein